MRISILSIFLCMLYVYCSAKSDSQDSIIKCEMEVATVFSDMKIYYTSPLSVDMYDGEKIKTMTAFLDLSEAFSVDEQHPLIDPSDFDKDTVKMSSAQRASLLRLAGISDSDTVFIYNFEVDTVYKYSVSNLPAIACVNIYSSGDGIVYDLYDYEFGLDLGNRYTADGNNFTYVGRANPFRTGQMKPIVWQRIARRRFPVKLNEKLIRKLLPEDRKEARIDFGNTYKFSYGHLNYYLQDLKQRDREAVIAENNGATDRYMVVVDTKTNKVLYFEMLSDDNEGGAISPLVIENEKSQYNIQNQWTGEPFKGKSAIIYGFYYTSFGCPIISFVDEKDLPIYILCDNRH